MFGPTFKLLLLTLCNGLRREGGTRFHDKNSNKVLTLESVPGFTIGASDEQWCGQGIS